MSQLDLGPVGVSIDVSEDGTHLEEARELEALGYRAVWVAGGQLESLDLVTRLVQATRDLRVGTAISSPHVYDADEVVRFHAALQAGAEGRFVVGLGGSQQPRSLDALHDYLDRLDRAPVPVPVGRRLLAALGPRKLEIARDRCAGAITLLVTPAFTRHARAALGEHSTLVVDQFVVLETDPDRARRTARGHLEFLAGVAGYRTNFSRMGFSDTDISTISDRLVDELVAWGDLDAVVARIEAHHDSGADHVILAVLSDDGRPGTLEVARMLAERRRGPTTFVH